ncbi:MAG TPA: hypothetical protein VHP58_05660 [Alphaproteobacteria bacterium]|nr:hypothetical protein [Alphaproteobacteria bacterium]
MSGLDMIAQAPESRPRRKASVIDAMERIDTEFRRQILKYQKKLAKGLTLEAVTDSEKEAEAYFATDLFRKLALELLNKGYVLTQIGAYDDGENGKPNAAFFITTPVM